MLFKSIIMCMLFCQTGKKLIILIRELLKEKMRDCLPAFVQVCGSPAFISPSPFSRGGNKEKDQQINNSKNEGKKWVKKLFSMLQKGEEL